MNTVYAIRHSETGAVVGDRVELANRPWTRLKGLIGRDELMEGEGLILAPCQAVHMYGVRYPIDVVFLDECYAVVAIYEALEPGTRTQTHREAHYALELPVGTTTRSGLRIGDRVHLERMH